MSVCVWKTQQSVTDHRNKGLHLIIRWALLMGYILPKEDPTTAIQQETLQPFQHTSSYFVSTGGKKLRLEPR